MSLVRKTSTPALIAANRANSQKTTGAITPAGKKNSNLNRASHGLYARQFRPYLSQLGEDPEGFEELRQSLHASLSPEGKLEEILVDQLAELRWSQLRVRRATDAKAVARRRKQELENEQRRIGEDKGLAGSATKFIMQSNGVVAAPDSTQKFALILAILRDMRARVELEGFDEKMLEYLRVIYGPEPGLAGGSLISECERGLKNREEEETEQQEGNRRNFIAAARREIESYEKLAAIYMEVHLSISEAAQDAALIPQGKELKSILSLERRAERGFHNKLEEWFGCQREKRQANAIEVVASRDARPALPAPAAKRRGRPDLPTAEN